MDTKKYFYFIVICFLISANVFAGAIHEGNVTANQGAFISTANIGFVGTALSAKKLAVTANISHTEIGDIGSISHAGLDLTVASFNIHEADISNPHTVSSNQVGNTEPTWNANQIMSIDINVSGIDVDSRLAYNGSSWVVSGDAGAGSGEANTLGSVGTGVTLNAAQESLELKIKSIHDGSYVSINSNSTDITINVVSLPVEIGLACSDETTALTTGNAKITFRAPYAFTLTSVRANVNTAPSGSVLTVDINESGSTVLSTKLTIDATEETSTTAVTPNVISDSAIADDAEITIDIDTIGSGTAGTGLKVWLIGTR